MLGSRVASLLDRIVPGSVDESRPNERASWRLRRLLTGVFAVGAMHAAFYALVFPPWAIEDEEQHVDYVWKLAFDHRLPRFDDPLDQSIIDSAASTDRWGDYGLRPPPAFVPDAMGFEGYSYEAYHPPLVYTALVPFARLIGDRPLVLMYLLRGVSVAAAGAVSALTALLAWTWCTEPRRRMVIAGAGGLAAAALPAVADSGGRVNTDIFAALLVLLGVLVLARWLEQPTSSRAWAVGGILAAAVLTRETTVVLVVPVVVTGIVALRRGQLTLRDAARVVVAPIAAWAAWLVYFRRSAGYWDPSEALRDRLGAHHPYRGFRDFLHDLTERALVPYADTWPLPDALTVALGVVVIVGLILAARSGAAVPALIAAGGLLLAVALLFQQSLENSTTATARLLLPAYPLVLAAATNGWASARRAWAAAVVPATAGVIALLFLAGSFLPEYGPVVSL